MRPASTSLLVTWGLANTVHCMTIGATVPTIPILAGGFRYGAVCDGAACISHRAQGSDRKEDEIEETPEADTTEETETIDSLSESDSSSWPSSPTSPLAAQRTDQTPVLRDAISHMKAVEISLGTVFGALLLAVIFFFVRRRLRRRAPAPNGFEEISSPPSSSYTLPTTPSRTPSLRPSMRERSDRYSERHTPAGTPLSRTPLLFLTPLSSLTSDSSMQWKHIASLPAEVPEKDSDVPVSVRGADPQPGLDPPPEYETSR